MKRTILILAILRLTAAQTMVRSLDKRLNRLNRALDRAIGV